MITFWLLLSLICTTIFLHLCAVAEYPEGRSIIPRMDMEV